MMAFLSPLGARVGFGLSVALLIASGVLWGLLQAERAHSAKLETRLAKEIAAHEADRLKAERDLAQFRADAKARQSQQTKATLNVEASLRARLDRELDRVRGKAKANSPGSHPGGLPGPSGTPPAPSGAGQAPVMDEADRLICTEAVIKAEGVQEWWESVKR